MNKKHTEEKFKEKFLEEFHLKYPNFKILEFTSMSSKIIVEDKYGIQYIKSDAYTVLKTNFTSKSVFNKIDYINLKLKESGIKTNFVEIIELFEKNKNGQYIFSCKCDCGKIRIATFAHLVSGQVNNCGCKNFISKTHGNSKYSPEEASFRAKAANCKSHAKRRKIEFKLSLEEAIILMKKNCVYCNKPPSNLYNVRTSNRINLKNINNYAINNSDGYGIFYSGIDRIDNEKGYTIENSAPCCTQCNTAKLIFSIEEFKDWIKRVYFNFIIK